MCAHKSPDQHGVARLEGLLTWLGGGHAGEPEERHERSTHAIAGAVVALGASLAWLVAALALTASTSWPAWAVVVSTLLFGILVAAVARSTISGPARRWPDIAARAVVAVAVGAVVGDIAALVLFSGSIDHRLAENALRNADSAPAVAQAAAAARQTSASRTSLDTAVDRARTHLDEALVVARCEYHPTPACPQTRITGVPGQGPETRTANKLLADAQRDLDNALAARDAQAPQLDATIAREEQTLTEARAAVVAGADHGLGARWVTMNELTMTGVGVLLLRLLTVALCALLYLLPLIVRLWRGETTQDRHSSARADQDRAEVDADTAIAIKRAQVRRDAEIMWAEHQLAQTRLAIEAQAEIDREQQRRRVAEALEAPVHAGLERVIEPVAEDVYLPIAAEAEAASRAITPLPTVAQDDFPDESLNGALDDAETLPATIEPDSAPVQRQQKRGAPVIPSIPDATKAATRWIRPLVPPFVARVIDNTTAPLRSARQVFEEVEEITFSFKRTHKVTVNSESSTGDGQGPSDAAATDTHSRRSHVASSRAGADRGASYHHLGTSRQHQSLQPGASNDLSDIAIRSGEPGQRELAERQGPRALRSPDGPPELPPGK
ncbi:DUF4407 domain-containing protein [Mycobacterium kubicae]|nr:DUF4407 domain-containing protein [Mycobacterium kubicae]MCV7095879.1 DUF4407 domain-containing protein [Mycobacterium kubicae]ORV99484.1 hypothetical protein AWC13_10075 [Mycobacterium kubicae]QNI12053.1 DUF4407 domain-containing protein [Mycobacterium kubicae]QPI40712.1 DUF4407 domain-containing protein [Mycobacterium kubicae]